MFRDWGFLLGEIWVLLILAALIGLLAGWLIWGRREVNIAGGDSGDAARLQADLDTCRAGHADKDARIAELEAAATQAKMGAEANAPAIAPAKASVKAASTAGAAAPAANASDTADAGQDYDGDGVVEGKDEGSKPQTLTAARDGKADDLKMIKGIGPKLEKLCNSLGFYHFDQVASWTAQEVAWVDANLEGFKGRVSRDNWVEQAKLLAAGGETEFSKKVEKGGVYE